MQKWVRTYRDILHIYFSPYYKRLPAREFYSVAPKKFGNRLKLILRTFEKRVTQLAKPDLSTSDEHLGGRIWLFAMSKNNLDALNVIYASFPETVFVLDKPRVEFSGLRFAVPNLRYQIFSLFKFFWIFFSLVCREGKYAVLISNIIFRSLGFYEEWIRLLKKWRPRAVIFSNDHNIEARALLLAASRLNIPTIYIQHASVSLSFPPLKFDLNLLEGRDAYDKYKAIGQITGSVKLVGMPKFDDYLKYRRSVTDLSRIGIPYNLNDDPEVLEELITRVHGAFPNKIITLRKHPKDKTPFSIASKFGALIESDPSRESAFEFLINQDCIIAGNSSIHLEATLLNIPAIYFVSEKQNLLGDYYGYIEKQLVPDATDVSAVIDLIESFERDKPDSYFKAKYFNDLVGTDMEGKSGALVTRIISDYLN